MEIIPRFLAHCFFGRFHRIPMRLLVLEHGDEDVQTFFVWPTACDAHDPVSIGSGEMSLVSDENSDAQSGNENSVGANDKFLVMI